MTTAPISSDKATAQAWADALGSIPSFNSDIVFIKAVVPALIQQRSPKPGDKMAMAAIAADAVFLVNEIMDCLANQFKNTATALEVNPSGNVA